jgi:hypothetical protein
VINEAIASFEKVRFHDVILAPDGSCFLHHMDLRNVLYFVAEKANQPYKETKAV